MTLVKPFRGLRPAPGRAADVLAPPYDVLNSAEARQRAAGRPWSFLHISKPEIDLPEGIDPHDPAVYAKAAENMQMMQEAGVLIRDPAPCYYVYRLVWEGREKTGIVGVASVAAYESNRIRRHEFTQPAKEDDRVRQIEAVNAQTGPVMLAYPEAPELDALIARAAQGQPEVDVTADDGVRHMMWVLSDPAACAEITQAFDALPALYIADGHHRSAAAARVCHARATGEGDAEAPYRYFLSVIFPHHEMRILDYNRVVRDLNGMSADAFLAALADSFTVTPLDAPMKPERPREFAMYLGGRWYRLALRPEIAVPDDPVKRLDVSLLSDLVIAPLLGITDQRRDPRIDFVGGIRGLEELKRRVDSGEMAVAFAFYPTSMTELMAVADAGEVMPTKSTWFEPKLADGLVSHLLT